MNRDASTIWLRGGAAVFLALLAAAAIWYFVGPRWGASAGFVFALLLLGRHLSNAGALLRWLRDPTRPVPDGSGIWEDIFAELHRLARSQRLEHERLTAALARFRSAGLAMPDAVVILDAQDHIEWCNPMAERFLGIDAAKDAGQAIINLVRAPDFAAYLRQGAYGDPLVIRMAREEELTLSLRVIAYGQDQKLLLCRDVTQASRLETMRRDFVANVSHELKTPLTVVNGFLETLLDARIRFTESRSREIFGLMQQQTARMLRLVEDLLTLSALESSPGLSDESDVEVAKLLESLHEECLALSAGRHRVSLAVGQAALVAGSESELRSAFGNLVANAVHYTQPGGEVRIAWRVRDSGEGEFSVTDTGAGFEAYHIPRLTERFYRIDQSRSRETGGTGLGLAIVKHVLTRHQAALEISSEPGRGSRFAAVLPARRVRTADQARVSMPKLARS